MLLYHYTDASAVQSILQYGKMRLTDMRYLNDSTEIIYGSNLILSEVSSGRLTHRLNKDYAVASSEYVIEKLSHLIGAGFNDYPAYSLSFSEVGDLLSQWRSYGGYAIEIDTALWLQELARCEYEESNAKRNSFEPIIDALRLIGRDLRDFSGRPSMRGHEGYMDLIKYAATLKHPGFSEEKEWRLLLDKRAADSKAVKFRPRGDILIPYIDIEMPLECVTSIIVGPTKHQDMACQSIREFVEQLTRTKTNHPGIKVLKSATPYRSA